MSPSISLPAALLGAQFPVVVMVAFVALAVAIVLGAIYQGRREKQRSEALRGWAAHHGLAFAPKSERKDSSYDERFPGFDCLRQGDQRYAYNLCTGERASRGLDAFDYHYRTESRDSKGNTQYDHYDFSVLVLDSRLALRPLFLRTEHFWDKLTATFGFDDIDFESAEFSREFYVKSPDRKWAYDVISQDTMEFLMRAPRFTIQFGGPYVMLWRNRRFKPAEFEHALGVGEGLLDRIPADLQKALSL